MAKPTISGPGRLDAMVANLAGDNISVRLGNGAGGFVANSGAPEPTGDMPERLALGDINNDGLVDVAAANFGSDNVTVRLATGVIANGFVGFAPAPGSPLAVGDGPFTPKLGDLNGDGKLDLVVTISHDANCGAISLLGRRIDSTRRRRVNVRAVVDSSGPMRAPRP